MRGQEAFPERRREGVFCKSTASVSPSAKYTVVDGGRSLAGYTQKSWVLQRSSKGPSLPLILEGSSWSSAGDRGPEPEGQAR